MTPIVQSSSRTTSSDPPERGLSSARRPHGPCAGAGSWGPRSRRRRRLLVTALLAALTTGPVLTACSTEGQRGTAPTHHAHQSNSEASAQQADGNNDAHAAATRGSTVSATVCPRPDVHLIVGDTTLAVPTDSTTGRLTVRVGQVIYLQAEGICTRSVSATPRNPDLNRPIVRVEAAAEAAPEHGDRAYKAVRPGRVILDISMSACEQPPGTPPDGCFGGPSIFGAVTVVVHR
jgi:hypothetical protein